jgi:hypothetical protein
MTTVPPTERGPRDRPVGEVPTTARDGERGWSGGYVRVNLPPPLAERYRVLGELGSPGGEADILRCLRNQDDRETAVKLYRGRREDVRTDMARMRKRLSRADPRHVVEVLESGDFDGHWYEVQEFVELGSLHDLAQREGPALGLELMDEVLVETVSALEHLHGLGVVHRDVKPSNILVRTRHPLDLVLADFGLAVVLNASREQRSGSRTAAYAAPEASWGDTSVSRDWWSLGVSLVELATGEHPFCLPDGRWLEDAQIGSLLATRPIDVGGVTDERWRLLLRGLLTRDPTLRWKAAEVREWLAGKSPEVRDQIPAEATAGVRRRPFAFQGKKYFEPGELAAAMIASREAWTGAVQVILGRDLDELAVWLERQEPSQGVLRALQDCRQKRWRPDRLIASLVLELNPELPPTFRGFAIAPGDLATLAADATSKGADRQVVDAIKFLAQSRALLTYAGCPGCEDYAVVDDLWQRNLEELQRRLGSVKAPDALVEKADDAAAAPLLMLLEPGQRNRWHEQAETAATKELMQRPWYQELCAPAAAPELQPARDWLRVAGAPLAQEELATERAAEFHAQNALRNQALERTRREEKRAEDARAAERERAWDEFGSAIQRIFIGAGIAIAAALVLGIAWLILFDLIVVPAVCGLSCQGSSSVFQYLGFWVPAGIWVVYAIVEMVGSIRRLARSGRER